MTNHRNGQGVTPSLSFNVIGHNPYNDAPEVWRRASLVAEMEKQGRYLRSLKPARLT